MPTGAGWGICTHPHNSFSPYMPLVSRGKMEQKNPLWQIAPLVGSGRGLFSKCTLPPLPRHGHYPTQKSTLIRPQSGYDFYL